MLSGDNVIYRMSSWDQREKKPLGVVEETSYNWGHLTCVSTHHLKLPKEEKE